MESIQDILALKFYGNTVTDWGLGIAAFLITFTVLPFLKSYLIRVAKRHPHASELVVVQVSLRLIPRTSRIFVLVVALNLAMRFLDFAPKVERALAFLIQVGIWFQIGLWAVTIVTYLLDRKRAPQGQADPGFVSSLGIISFILHAVIWTIVVLLALDNLGVNITTLVAGLGIGGIAIALAVQTVLGDLLASLSITFDKPFSVGDSLSIDNINGKVEQIGIRSTRLRSVDGEQIIISNTDLLKSRVRNFGRMGERRGVVNLQIHNSTAVDKVRRVRAIVEEAIKSQKGLRLERCYFKEIAAASFNFEAVYFVADGNFDTLANGQQAVNLQILESFEKEGIEFASAAQTVKIVQDSAE
ncbi:MAG TPA: mechanosensitive ion channel family protein [Steroidobacteraceae bacterium]|nr:mechanosensitive ion channel family protein [Steroidobacteraceae bacterium]